MKLNFFAVLFTILVNALCILSIPVETKTDGNFEKRDWFEDLIEIILKNDYGCLADGGPTGGPWTCCNYDCMREKSSNCRAACFKSRPNGCVAC